MKEFFFKQVTFCFKSIEHSSTRWAYIHGLCEKAIYGGRITNVQDIAILTTYLRCVFTSDNVNWKDGIPGITDLNSGDVKVCISCICVCKMTNISFKKNYQKLK